MAKTENEFGGYHHYFCMICHKRSLSFPTTNRSLLMKIDNPKNKKKFACPTCYDKLPDSEKNQYTTYRGGIDV